MKLWQYFYKSNPLADYLPEGVDDVQGWGSTGPAFDAVFDRVSPDVISAGSVAFALLGGACLALSATSAGGGRRCAGARWSAAGFRDGAARQTCGTRWENSRAMPSCARVSSGV